MRATRAPSAPVVSSIVAPDRRPFAPRNVLRAPATSTSRKSTKSVNGSGRLVTYAAGSLVSMLTVVMRRPALADIPFSFGAGGVAESGAPAPAARSGGGPNASSGVRPAAHNPARSSSKAPPVRTYASRCVLFDIFRRPESLSHFALFNEREWIVDFLHDDDALRRHTSDDAIEQAIVHMR